MGGKRKHKDGEDDKALHGFMINSLSVITILPRLPCFTGVVKILELPEFTFVHPSSINLSSKSCTV
jgi:hypothetical protein